MPKELERKLERQAARRHLIGKKKDAYIYGTLRKTGWKPSGERKSIKRSVGKKNKDQNSHGSVKR